MIEQPQILYTAEATATGGREGHARTSDGRLDVDLDVPSEMGGSGGPGTNPEQLFAAGYAACFQSALLRFAAGRKLDLSESRITARVGIGLLKSTGGFGLSAWLDLDAPQINRADAVELMERAHETCPYSRATRGNIEVTFTVAVRAPSVRPPDRDLEPLALRVSGRENGDNRRVSLATDRVGGDCAQGRRDDRSRCATSCAAAGAARGCPGSA